MWRRRTALALVLVAFAPPAYADDANADALTKQGIELRRQHRDAEALEAFRRAFAITPTPRARAQIALAEQALGRWLEADDDLRQALAHTDDVWIAKNRGVLERAREAIEARLGWLEVAADALGAELWVNGTRRGVLPLDTPVRVEAGTVVVEVRATGYETARRIVAVGPGGSAREDLHLVRLPPSDAAPESAHIEAPTPASQLRAPPPRARNARLENAGLVAIGAGVAGVAAGAYFGVRTLQTKAQRDDHCGAASCDGQGVALDGKARALATRSTAWFGAGLLVGASGAVMFWVARSARRQESAFRVAPDLGPDRAGVILGGSF